jgi:hypothetical protein
LRFFRVLILSLVFFQNAGYVPGVLSASADEPLPAVSPAPAVDPDFLLLPAFDLEPIKPLQDRKVQVGDELLLKISGIRIPRIENAVKELNVSAAPNENLSDQGWEVTPRTSPTELPASEFLLSAVPLKPGKLYLPSLALKNSAGTAVGRTNPFSVEVDSAIAKNDPKPQQPEELEPPVGLQFPWWILALMGLAGSLVLGLLTYALYRWYKRRKAKISLIPAVVRTEDEIALTRLVELQQLELVRKGDFKGHYFRISEILKSYVGDRYDFDALESTTQEMIRLLEEKKSTVDTAIDRLESVFNKLDRVKFTDHLPAEEESAKLLDDAKEFVLNTRRPPTILETTGVNKNEVR